MDFVTVGSLEAENPDLEIWQGVDQFWYARRKGDASPCAKGEDLQDLRDEIKRWRS